MLGPEWKIIVLNSKPGSVGYYRDFIEEHYLPEGFDKIYFWETKSDIIRLSLLLKYGGVWMDPSIILHKSLDDWCFNKFDDPEAKIIMCGFYLPGKIEKWKDYNFEKGEDFFESAFIASKKNNPIIAKWHLVLKEYWNNRVYLDKNILNHELFKDLPRNFFSADYLTIHVSLRKLLG
jgi:hypothetical protein